MVEIDLEYLHLSVLWAQFISSALLLRDQRAFTNKNLEAIIEQRYQICYIVLRFHALFSLNFYNPVTEGFNFWSYVYSVSFQVILYHRVPC